MSASEAHQEIPVPTAGAAIRTDRRGGRVTTAVAALPGKVLNAHHRGYVRQLRAAGELEDAVADGVVQLLRWDRRWPGEMTAPVFLNRAAGCLRRYYIRHRLRRAGQYRAADKTVRETLAARRVDWEGVGEMLPAPPPPALADADMDEVFGRLTTDERAVVLGTHYLGLSAVEIGGRLGIDRRTVAGHLQRTYGRVKGVLS